MTTIPPIDASTLPESLRACAERFQAYKSPIPEFSIASHPSEFSPSRLAAVLVLIYERDGRLRVLLTTRARSLRSHPGQVALPGGKSEVTDENPVVTALREANEEVRLPLDCPGVRPLCILHPFISLFKIVVTPVVAILTDTNVLDHLVPHPDEVDDIFDHPLEGFLDPHVLADEKNLSEKGGEKWPYDVDFHSTSETTWIRDGPYRMHRFRSTSTPIKGLTSDILILAAEIAFAKKPVYDRFAPGQMGFGERAIEWVMEDVRLMVKKTETAVVNPDEPGPLST